MKSKHWPFVLYIITLFYQVFGQTILYVGLNTNVTLNCPFRQSVTDGLTLIWLGPPYTGNLGTTYITSNDGANPNTVLGNRLSVVGNHTAGEYNMEISNLQQSDEGKYICGYGNNRMYFNLRIKIPLTSVTINSQSITVIEGRTSQVTCTTSDSVPAANVTWYILRQGSPTVQITYGITNIHDNKKTKSTLTYIGQKQDNNGNIYCNASQKTTQIKSISVPISVLYKPRNIRIAPLFEPYIVYVTQTGVQLQCTADVGNPPSIAYTLSHNGVDTSNNPYVITVTKNSGGNYTCTASNAAGKIAAYRMIKVQYGPEIQPFTKQQPVESSKFVLFCYVSGKPAPTAQQIWWTRQNDNTFRQQGNQLVIDNIQKEQSGTYTCHAQNTLTPSGQDSINKTATQNVEVDVLYKPVLTTSPNFNSLILYLGQQNVQITCNSTKANPSSVSYWWTYNNRNYNGPIYNLQTVTKTSGGNYTCNGRNAVGTSSFRVSIVVRLPVTSITMSPTTVALVEGRSLQVTCTSSDSFPAASVTWYILRQGLSTAVKITLGVNSTQHNMKTISTLLYTGDPEDNAAYLYCSATNKEQNMPVQSENSSIRVLYPPKLEPVLTGYTPGSILYDGDLDLLLNCQQEGGNPLSVIRWLNITEGVADNSTSYISSSYIELPVNRQLYGYTCTCLVTYPGTHAEYSRSLSVTVSVLYLSINEASETKTYESTDDIKLRCLANLQNYDITFTAWTHRVGSVLVRTIPGQLSNRTNTLEIPFSGYQDIGIYTCHGYNKYNRRMKSQDIQINVNDQPVFTDNITIRDSDRMTEINVDYFSVPKPIKVEWLKNENILYMSEKYIQNNIVTDVSLTFHKIKVKIRGYRSTLSIMSSEENDHGNYILRVQNAKGTVLQKIEYFPTESQNLGMPKSTIIAVVVGVILMAILTIGGILFFVCIWRKRKENNSSQRPTECDIEEDKSTYDNINVQSKTDETTFEMKEQVKDFSNVYEELQQQNDTEGVYNSIATKQKKY